MNELVLKMMLHYRFIQRIRDGLPFAFQIAEVNHRDPATRKIRPDVGFTREEVLRSLIAQHLGDSMVEYTSGQKSQKDLLVNGQPLEIKSCTDSRGKPGLVTAKWTSDTHRVSEEIDKFRFHADMLLVRVVWGVEVKSLFYIPTEALFSVAQRYRKSSDFLRNPPKADNRGAKVTHEFMLAAQNHAKTISIAINWRRVDHPFQTPADRWRSYWLNEEYAVNGYPAPQPRAALGKKPRQGGERQGNARPPESKQAALL